MGWCKKRFLSREMTQESRNSNNCGKKERYSHIDKPQSTTLKSCHPNFNTKLKNVPVKGRLWLETEGY